MSQPNQPIYTLKDIKVKYSRNTALNIPNFKFHRGAIYAITGPMSCGKSTFLNLLSFKLKNYLGVLLYEEKLFKQKWYDQTSHPKGILFSGFYPQRSKETIQEFFTKVFKEKTNEIKKQYFLKDELINRVSCLKILGIDSSIDKPLEFDSFLNFFKFGKICNTLIYKRLNRYLLYKKYLNCHSGIML